MDVLQVTTPATASKMTTLRVLHFHNFRCYNPVIPPGFCLHIYQIENQTGKVQVLKTTLFIAIHFVSHETWRWGLKRQLLITAARRD
jgi:hypothetical protein